MVVSQLPRIFKIGATQFDDPCVGGSLADCHEHFAGVMPQVRHTTLFESDGVPNDSMTAMVYTYLLLPPKTNG